jgi:regulatory protein
MRGCEVPEIEAALERLAASGLQSDTRWAEALSARRRRQGYGPGRIAAELRHLGGTGCETAGTTGEDWAERARHALRKRFGGVGATDRLARQSQVRFLVTRGFTPELAVRVVAEGPVDGADDAE